MGLIFRLLIGCALPCLQGFRFSEVEIRASVLKIVGTEVSFEIVSIMPWIRRLMVADSYGKGHVVLSSDAVHMFSPTGGNGLNTGIQDAADLSWKLDSVLKGWADPHIRPTYEIERGPVGIRNITEASENLGRMVMPQFDPAMFEAGLEGNAARFDFGCRNTQSMRREWFTRSIHLSYRNEHSPIIVPDGSTEAPDHPAIYIKTTRPVIAHRISGSRNTADRHLTVLARSACSCASETMLQIQMNY